MDWRRRAYYTVKFDPWSYDMRVDIFKNIEGVKLHPYKAVPKQKDEKEFRGRYHFVISCPIEAVEAIEFELRKAERRDDFCKWGRIIKDENV